MFLGVLVSSILLSSFNCFAGNVAEDLTDFLYSLRGEMRTNYAPAEWKKKFAGYDLNSEFSIAINSAQATPNLTLKQAQGILSKFVYSTRDYHTSIGFVSTEVATLPLTIKGVGKKYFIVFIDRSKLPEDSFPFSIGDEVVTFAGQDTHTVVAELQTRTVENVASTDKAIAELSLTRRRASRGFAVPQGPVTLGFRSPGAQTVKNHQLVWDYTPEKIADVSSTFHFFKNEKASTPGFRPPRMISRLAMDLAAPENPFAIGSRKSFLPPLGTKVWESGADNTFHAYIYRDGAKLIGYVRIFGYVVNDYLKAVRDFSQIIAQFQASTDSMVIDQVDNPGGSVYYLYALASMLTEQPLITPQHRMTITQGDVAAAVEQLEFLDGIKTEEEAKKAIKESDLDGMPVTYQYARFSANFSRFIIDEWTQGRRLTRPFWIGGIDHINPNPVHYTKPILVLINNLDFSGGDFFPTILQDNKRVTILGSRTAGAGGYVLESKTFNALGVDFVAMTGSIASRVDGNPIENLGVTPDLPYEMTETDYTDNFSSYLKTIRQTILGMTP